MNRAAHLLLVVLALCLPSIMGAPAASAHAILLSADPADNAALATGPDKVSATFNEQMQPEFAAMTVVGPDGNLWSSGPPEVQGATVGVGLRRPTTLTTVASARLATKAVSPSGCRTTEQGSRPVGTTAVRASVVGSKIEIEPCS